MRSNANSRRISGYSTTPPGSKRKKPAARTARKWKRRGPKRRREIRLAPMPCRRLEIPNWERRLIFKI